MVHNLYGGRGATLLAIGWALAGLTAILLGMRIYVRVRFRQNGGWALAWFSIAFTSCLIETCFITVAVAYGLGNRFAKADAAGEVSTLLFWTWLSCCLFLLNIASGKVAAVSFLLNLHAGTYPWRRALLHFIALSNVVFAVPAAIAIWFSCGSPHNILTVEGLEACSSTSVMDYARFLTVWSAFSDIMLVILPILLVYNLQMALHLKLTISFLMGLGVFAAASALLVTYYFRDLTTPDVTYNMSTIILWGKATTWLVLLSAGVPPAWPLLRQCIGAAPKASRLFSPRRRSSGMSPPPAPGARDTLIRLGSRSPTRNAGGVQVAMQGHIVEEHEEQLPEVEMTWQDLFKAERASQRSSPPAEAHIKSHLPSRQAGAPPRASARVSGAGVAVV